MTPSAKREILAVLVQDHGLPVRRACQAVRLSRAAYYRPPRSRLLRDTDVVIALNDVVARHTRWGFWKCFYRLRRAGHGWNHKRVHRVYCALRLNLPRRTKRRIPARVRQPLIARVLAGGGSLNPAGRPPGIEERFPRNSVQAMDELIAGRILRNSEDQAGNPIKDEAGNPILKTAAEIMADAILDGMEGKLILSHNQHGDVIANPINAVKLYHDYMLRAQELALKAEALKRKEKGVTGGIRIVLPSVPRDPTPRRIAGASTCRRSPASW